MTQAAFWDKIAEKYAKDKIADPAAYEYTLERTRSYLTPEDTVVEFGAGTSSTALLLAPSVRAYLATDISAEMVRIGREKLAQAPVPGLEIAQGSTDSLPKPGPFDAALALNLLHLVADVPASLAAIHRCLKPGGVFISKSACLSSNPSRVKRLAFRALIPVAQALGKAPRPVTYMSIPELEHMVTQAGFEIIEAGNYPNTTPSRYLVARRV